MVTGSLIRGPSRMIIARARGRSTVVIRLGIKPTSVNGIVKQRKEVTGTVQAIMGTTSSGDDGGIVMSVLR